ncbi:MAG TPA: hypothetical protein PK957_02485 [Candidatus Dojkabacteria bacterium]|nr:hypothetical protein [Candidatus Dojkabacteria bacterium]HQF36382.1 hypothetical protein [Candidatus Dojkabacteria bacterium]
MQQLKNYLNELITSALALIGNQDSYLINAGLSILALQKIIEEFRRQNRADELNANFLRFIPTEEKLVLLGEQDPEFYNFIRSVEGLLRLDPDGEWQGMLTETHQQKIKTACEADDLEGTKIRKHFRPDLE